MPICYLEMDSYHYWAPLVAQTVNNLPARQETQI